MSRDRKILQAAAKLFYERGFDAVGVDEIGELAGITGPAIYRHFNGKDEILAVLFDEALDGLLEVTGGIFDDPVEELRHLARRHAAFVLSERQLASVFVREDRSLAERYRRRIHRRSKQYIDRWIYCLERCFPHRSQDSLVSAAYAALGLLNSVALWPSEALRTEGLPELMATMVMQGLQGLRELSVAEPTEVELGRRASS